MAQVTEQKKPKAKTVKVEVSYLPAPKAFEERYSEETALSVVRTESMAFFGVENYTDRDQHEFFLEHDGTRITDYSVTLEALLGKARKGEFDLVEQVTAGGR